MNLTATTHTLELVTSSTSAIAWSMSGAIIDKTSATAYTPLSGAGTVSSATDTTIAAAPSGASVYHAITSIAARNTGGASNTVTVQKDVGGTEYPIASAVLLPGEALIYEDGSGWDAYAATGERKTSGRDGAAGAAGAPGVGTTGTATLDFGGYPGDTDASVTVTGQADIVADSVVEAWLRLADTTDHTADEHRVEEIAISAGDIVAGVGFTIYGRATNNQPQPTPLAYPVRVPGPGGGRNAQRRNNTVDRGNLIDGTWTVQWRWS